MSTRTTLRRGFTLVEMLVVIFIIGVLAALLIPAIGIAIRASQNTHMSFEVGNLKQAVESYKNTRGDYPPNFSEGGSAYYKTMPATSVVRRHIQLAFPKMNTASGSAGANFFTNGHADNVDEAETLVFWLSYTMDDVRDPLPDNSGSGFAFPKTQKIFFEFDQRRLVDYDGDGLFAYQPKYAKDSHYVYFDSRSYFNSTVKYTQVSGAMPYFKANNTNNPTEPIAAKAFQIICAGRDGEFGAISSGASRKDMTFASQNTPKNIDILANSGDLDNLTSFSEGKVLNDLLP